MCKIFNKQNIETFIGVTPVCHQVASLHVVL